MPIFLLLSFIGVPLIEIGVFIEVGGAIGLWPTLGLVIATAVAGTWLLRRQGLAVLARAREQMDRGVLPGREIFDGVCLLFAGALLLTPGFVTDTLGMLLFVQAFRDGLRSLLSKHIGTIRQTEVRVDGRRVREPGRGTVIDGEYEDLSDTEPPTRPDDTRHRDDMSPRNDMGRRLPR